VLATAIKAFSRPVTKVKVAVFRDLIAGDAASVASELATLKRVASEMQSAELLEMLRSVGS
jgi:hypothetical protein